MKASRFIALFLLTAAFSFPSAPAAGAGADKDDEGIPLTAVARLKINKGTAWVRPPDSREWEEYEGNSPVGERSRVSVPNGSEAEIRFRGSQTLLLRGGSEVEIRELGETHVTFRLQGGRVALSLPRDDFAPVRVRVPGNREAQMNAPGRYALAADGGETKFLVSEGEGAAAGEGAAPVVVKAGEVASIGEKIRVARADASAPEPPEAAAEAPLTEAEREAGIPPAAANELRDYGKWVWTPEYGYVWSPYAGEGWTPYYYGRWDWIYPYGWTWVAFEPWGWWPYHFGWWVSYPSFGWVWCPFNSFVSIDFVFGRSRFFFHRAAFCSANVFFVRDGRHIRWNPARPGTTTTRAAFSRGDTRLARWNKPLERGAVMVRGGDGRVKAWQGRGGKGGLAGTRGAVAGAAAGRAAGGGSVSSKALGGGMVSAAPRGSAGAGRPLAPSPTRRFSVPAGPGGRHTGGRDMGGGPGRWGNDGGARGEIRGFGGGAPRGFGGAPGGPGGGSFRGGGGGSFRGGPGGSRGGGFRGTGRGAMR